MCVTGWAPLRVARAMTATQRKGPIRALLLVHFAVFQITWFAAVYAAAQCKPMWSLVYVGGAIGWHLALAAKPWREATLVAIACLIGGLVESLLGLMGQVRFDCGMGIGGFAPPWLVGMWGLLAICLNVSLRWLRGRWLLCALLGALGGPLAFASGAALGAAQFANATAALWAIALAWSMAFPALVRLSMRLDGFGFVDARA